MKIMFATFLLVSLRAWQQQNVVHGHYVNATITSYAMALANVAVVLGVVHTGWPAIPWMGTGGALGVITAMYAHRRWTSRRFKAAG